MAGTGQEWAYVLTVVRLWEETEVRPLIEVRREQYKYKVSEVIKPHSPWRC